MRPKRLEWLIPVKPRPDAALRLFCFPYAGGGSAVFRGWADDLPAFVEVFSIQLPGRESRIAEPPLTRVSALTHTLSRIIVPYLEKPFAFFGHSLGALVGFELARCLSRQHGVAPACLFVSACHAPQIRTTKRPIHALPEAEFLRELSRLNGSPREALEQPELMQVLLPALRADFEAYETYIYESGPPLNCPLQVFGGLQDTELTQGNLVAWREQTDDIFSLHMLPGDHFFLHTARSLLLQMVSHSLCETAQTVKAIL